LNRIVPAAITLLMLSACADEFDAQLLVPDDIDVEWDESFNRTSDGIGVLVPIDVMVYEANTGEALYEVQLHVDTGLDTAMVVADDGVELVEVVDFDAEDAEWDVWRDRYFTFDAPNDVVEVQTDPDGLARIYVWVDAFEAGPVGFAPVTVTVSAVASESAGAFEETFSLIPR